MEPASALSPLLAHANTIVLGIAKDTAKEATEDAVQQLKSIVFAITSAGRHHINLSADEQTAVWELVCLLWVSAAVYKLLASCAPFASCDFLEITATAWLLCNLVAIWQKHCLSQVGAEAASLKYLLIAEHLCRCCQCVPQGHSTGGSYPDAPVCQASLLPHVYSMGTAFTSTVHKIASTASVQYTCQHHFP